MLIEKYLDLKKIKYDSFKDELLKEVKKNYYDEYYFHCIVLAFIIYIMIEKKIKDLDKLYAFFVDLNIDKKAKKELLKTVETINSDILELYDLNEIDDIAAFILFSTDITFSKIHENKTPSFLVDLSNRILNIEKGDRVIDFCSGIGEFLTYSTVFSNGSKYTGVELSEKNIIIASIKNYLVGENINYINDDFTSNDSMKLEGDKVFSNYPLGEKYLDILSKLSTNSKFSYLNDMKRSISYEWVYNKIISETISENGKAVIIMSNSGLRNDSDIKSRRYFLKNNLIESIIAMPDNIYTNSHMGTSVIVLSNSNKKIKMVDATKIFSVGRRKNNLYSDHIDEIMFHLNENTHLSESIDYADIKYPYNLYPKNYIKSDQKFHDMINLEEYILDIKRGPTIKSNDIDIMATTEKSKHKYLLTNNIIDGEIQGDLISFSEVSEYYEKFILNDKDVVLSKNGAPFKVAIYDKNISGKIIPNGNLYIIKIDESVANPYFIKAFLEEDQGQDMLNLMAKGSNIKNISIKDLKNVKVPKISKNKQDLFAKEYLERRHKINRKRKDLLREIQEKKLLVNKFIE